MGGSKVVLCYLITQYIVELLTTHSFWTNRVVLSQRLIRWHGELLLPQRGYEEIPKQKSRPLTCVSLWSSCSRFQRPLLFCQMGGGVREFVPREEYSNPCRLNSESGLSTSVWIIRIMRHIQDKETLRCMINTDGSVVYSVTPAQRCVVQFWNRNQFLLTLAF